MIADFQRALVEACMAEDPVARLQECLGDDTFDLTGPERTWLQQLDPDGLRITTLMVKKERFQRIIDGDAGLLAEFEADPESFTAEFARYIASQPPHCSARSEAATFRRCRGVVE